jgi:hypothetical protein
VGQSCQREREEARARVRLGWVAGPHASAGPRDAGERASAGVGTSARAGCSVGPSQKEGRRSGPIGVFVFLFQKCE